MEKEKKMVKKRVVNAAATATSKADGKSAEGRKVTPLKKAVKARKAAAPKASAGKKGCCGKPGCDTKKSGKPDGKPGVGINVIGIFRSPSPEEIEALINGAKQSEAISRLNRVRAAQKAENEMVFSTLQRLADMAGITLEGPATPAEARDAIRRILQELPCKAAHMEEDLEKEIKENEMVRNAAVMLDYAQITAIKRASARR